MASGEIFNLKGIGKGLGTAISQAVGEGKWPEDWEDLHTNTPEGLIEMLGIPGVGPKKIKMLHDELGVLSVADLQEACVKNEVAPMKGFGAKSQQKFSMVSIYSLDSQQDAASTLVSDMGKHSFQ